VFAGTAFFEKTYREALELLREARDYLAHCQRRDLRGLEPLDRLRFSREATRLTARLTDVMAWLFVQKALALGEITIEEASSHHHRLLRREVCLDDTGRTEGSLPRGLAELLRRSHALYLRIDRLDALIAPAAA
jgi:regulator of CtrA degradation